MRRDAARLRQVPVRFLGVSSAHDANPPRTVAGMAVAVLAVSNVVTHRWLPPRAYVPWNLGLAGGLVALARASGHSLEDMGLDRRGLSRGAKLGGMGSLVVGVAYAGLLGSGRADRLLSDLRLTRLSTRGTLWRLLVQIPVGTALAEEVVFRGVLPLFLHDPRHPAWTSPALASALFGLWHLLPAHEEASANRTAPGRCMAGTVISTTIAGGILHRLRTRAGHVAAPAALHFATNGLGLLAARMAGARR